MVRIAFDQMNLIKGDTLWTWRFTVVLHFHRVTPNPALIKPEGGFPQAKSREESPLRA